MKNFDFDRSETIFKMTVSFFGMLTMYGPGLRNPVVISADEISLQIHGVDTSGTFYDPATKILGFRSDHHIKYHLKQWKIRMTCSIIDAKIRKAAKAAYRYLNTPITKTGARSWYYSG